MRSKEEIKEMGEKVFAMLISKYPEFEWRIVGSFGDVIIRRKATFKDFDIAAIAPKTGIKKWMEKFCIAYDKITDLPEVENAMEKGILDIMPSYNIKVDEKVQIIPVENHADERYVFKEDNMKIIIEKY